MTQAEQPEPLALQVLFVLHMKALQQSSTRPDSFSRASQKPSGETLKAAGGSRPRTTNDLRCNRLH
ncbi:hypothetical protein EYF80_058457 [Liparis tanakae]|uniref:Uncharacterized protein n=1 Tax=Liparis tanakae TaxID=230148 RepID=A0A4Z2ERJ4_9TELE|nr:hypothetical protein EYF80_058457 [Liparis tanakae]